MPRLLHNRAAQPKVTAHASAFYTEAVQLCPELNDRMVISWDLLMQRLMISAA